MTTSHRSPRTTTGAAARTAARTIRQAAAPSAALFLLLTFSCSVTACSVFSMSSGGGAVMGRNLDWDVGLPGHVVVNPRGIEKTVLPWKGHWPEGLARGDGERPTVSWVSRYGSVTFTGYGRDFIESGMNEAGLMVAEASLFAEYAPDDGRPGVSCAQWMQYQLDSFATVEEVLAHIDELRLDGEGWHHIVADAAGNCAVIEFENGSSLVYTGDTVEVCALTNTTHSRALGHIRMSSAFGGESDIGLGGDSYGRFGRMAAMMRDYLPERDGTPRDYAFRILEEVGVDDTLRSVVYDAGDLRVMWTTRGNREVRWLDLADLDLSAGALALTADVEIGGPGDISGELNEYTTEANRVVVHGVTTSGDRPSDGREALEARGLTIDQVVDLIAGHPTAKHIGGEQ